MGLLPRFDRRAIVLGGIFSFLALVGLIVFAGAYDAVFPVLMGWVVAYVVVVRWLLGRSEEAEQEPGDGE